MARERKYKLIAPGEKRERPWNVSRKTASKEIRTGNVEWIRRVSKKAKDRGK